MHICTCTLWKMKRPLALGGKFRGDERKGKEGKDWKKRLCQSTKHNCNFPFFFGPCTHPALHPALVNVAMQLSLVAVMQDGLHSTTVFTFSPKASSKRKTFLRVLVS